MYVYQRLHSNAVVDIAEVEFGFLPPALRNTVPSRYLYSTTQGNTRQKSVGDLLFPSSTNHDNYSYVT
jgi:hypothetical protein